MGGKPSRRSGDAHDFAALRKEALKYSIEISLRKEVPKATKLDDITTRIIEESGSPTAKDFEMRALARFVLGQPDLAVADSNESVRLDPDNPKTLVSRCTLMSDLEKHEESIAAATKILSLTLDPQYDHATLAYQSRASSKYLLGRWADAIPDLTSSFEATNRSEINVKYNLLPMRALCFCHVGDFASASQDLLAWLALPEKEVDPMDFELVCCVYSVGNEKITELWRRFLPELEPNAGKELVQEYLEQCVG